MDNIINALKDTPLPTILVWAGLFFLLIAFVTKIGGIIEVAPDQKKFSIFIGLFLLIFGIVLSLSNPSKDVVIEKPQPFAQASDKIADPSVFSKQTPEQFIRQYYSLVSEEKLDLTWSLISDNHKACANDSLKKYLDFYRKIEDVSVIDTKTLGNFNEKPILQVLLKVNKKDGNSAENWTDFQFVYSESRNTWLIDATGKCVSY